MPLFAGPGVNPDLRGLVTNVISLPAGAVWMFPANWYEAKPGIYTVIQEYDPITTIWRTIGAGSTGANLERLYADGTNYRLANQTGCAVGAVVTTAGSGYTSVPTVTASTGGSIWRAIVGGAVATSVTVSNGGTGYVYPPTVLFAAPPYPGVQATGYATISAGVVTSVTITNQGAGYASPPQITFVNDPREGLNGLSTGYGAAAVASLTGSGTVTAIVCVDHGTAGTSIPTLTISGGGGSSAAATALMCWTITAYTVSSTTAGSGYVAPVILSGYNTPLSGSALTNPTIGNALVKGRRAFIIATVSGGALSATATILDGGIYDQTPTLYVQSAGPYGASPVAAVLTPTMGGVTDTSVVLTT